MTFPARQRSAWRAISSPANSIGADVLFMLISPQALDWNRLPRIGDRIVWTSETYGHFSRRFASASVPEAGAMDWQELPFEESQLDKIPRRGGIYLFTFTFHCLEFLRQDMILYLGEAGNLQTRVGQHWLTSRAALESGQSTNPVNHDQTMKLLFASFRNLMVSFCALNIPQDERRALERQMIGVLDPPFNWHHRPRPSGQPMVGRPGPNLLTTRAPQPAFRN